MLQNVSARQICLKSFVAFVHLADLAFFFLGTKEYLGDEQHFPCCCFEHHGAEELPIERFSHSEALAQCNQCTGELRAVIRFASLTKTWLMCGLYWKNQARSLINLGVMVKIGTISNQLHS